MSEVLKGWSTAKVSDLTTKVGSGSTPKGGKNAYKISGIPLIRSMNVHFDGFRLKGLAFIDDTQARKLQNVVVESGDVLLNITGASIGRVTTAPDDMAGARVNQHVSIIRPTEALSSKFLSWFLASPEQQSFIDRIQVGATRQALTKTMVLDFEVPLPPLPEQHRIVARIEEIFSRLDAGVATLRHAKAQLQRYRQSVLAAAVTGQLTQTWREQNPNTEPASELLERILEQRREQWNGRGKYKEPDSPDVSRMPKIPAAWKWARLDAICAIGSGMSVNKNRKPKNPIEVPYLRVANVQRGHLVLHEVKLMEIEADRLPLLALKKGDVLFNEGGDRDKLGRGWIWEGQIDPCITQNHVFRASAYDLKTILPKFLSHWGNVFGQQFFLDEGTQTTNLASINKGVLSSFPVPIPTIAEQLQIVTEVEARTTAIDHLEAELDLQITRANRLRQSTLAAAFSGKL